MRRGLPLGLLIWLSLPALCFAQGHPCDVPATLNGQIKADTPHKLQLCALAADNVLDAQIYVVGQPVLTRPLAPMSIPSATGYVLYETTKDLQWPVGNYVIEVSLRNLQFTGGLMQEGPKSPPFSFAAVFFQPSPSAPQFRGLVP